MQCNEILRNLEEEKYLDRKCGFTLWNNRKWKMGLKCSNFIIPDIHLNVKLMNMFTVYTFEESNDGWAVSPGLVLRGPWWKHIGEYWLSDMCGGGPWSVCEQTQTCFSEETNLPTNIHKAHVEYPLM